MPKARKPSSVTDSDVGDTEVMGKRFVEVLNDEGVLNTLKSALYPQPLSDKLDKLTRTIADLTSQVESKEKTTSPPWKRGWNDWRVSVTEWNRIPVGAI